MCRDGLAGAQGGPPLPPEELRPLSSPRNPKIDSLGVGDPSDRPNCDTIVSGTPDMTPVVLPGSLPFAVPAALRAFSSPRTPKFDSLGVREPSDRPHGDTIVSGTPEMTPVVLVGFFRNTPQTPLPGLRKDCSPVRASLVDPGHQKKIKAP